jgi:hypothetical protein
MNRLLILALILPIYAIANSPTRIDFKEAKISEEAIETDQGGVLENLDFWVQGRNIHYSRAKGASFVKAEGQLRIEYQGMLFVGSRIEYDLKARQGVLYSGKTQSGSFYISGEKIYFEPSGVCRIESARLTTCERDNPSWHIKAHNLKIAPDNQMRARDLTFKVLQMPVMWLPRMRTNLDSLPKSPFTFQAAWKSEAGPRVTLKYQFYRSKEAKVTGRFDFRFSRGPAFGLESKYQEGLTSFVTRSYISRDRTILNSKNKIRYRVEGAFKQTSQEGHAAIIATYDKLSDPQMPYDYPRDTFSLPLPKPTRLFAAYRARGPIFLSMDEHLKINSFETLKQSIPELKGTLAPLSSGRFGLLFSMPLQLAYLDYRYASRWKGQLNNFSSVRILSRPKLSLNLPTGPFLIGTSAEPSFGLYGTSLSGDAPASFVYVHSHGFAELPFKKAYATEIHLISPFATIDHYSEALTNGQEHAIFDTEDAYSKLLYARLGISNTFTSRQKSGARILAMNTYLLSLWNAKAFTAPWSKLGVDLDWQKPYLNGRLNAIWNREFSTLEQFNIGCAWTFSSSVAMNVEFRYRSKYSLRKADPSRYFVEATHAMSELLSSPLSDARTTALFDLSCRLSPTWRLRLESRHGWHRTLQEPFNDFRIELGKFLACNLDISFYVQHTNANRIKGGFKVSVNKKPHQPKLKVKSVRPKWG